MTVAVYQAELSGRIEGAGVNSWTFVQAQIPSSPFPPESVDVVRDALATFYTNLGSYIPGSLDILLPSSADLFNEGTGQLQEVVTSTQPPVVVDGTVTVSLTSLATQLKIQTRTGSVQDGRELRGGIFLGPIAETAIASTGLVSAAAQAAVNTQGATLLSTLAAGGVFMVVWRRPRPASAPGGARAGSLAIVQSISVSQRPAVLRSRRD